MSEQDWTSASAPGLTPKITSIFDFSAEALGQLKVWLEQAGLSLPISNILGFQQFTAQTASTIATSETTTSATFVDLATVGPVLTEMPSGKYLVFYSSRCSTSASGNPAYMGVKVNSTLPATSDSASTSSTTTNSVTGFTTVSLTEANNTLTVVYLCEGGSTGTFRERRMVALRYENA